VPTIFGWTSQKYGYSPSLSNVKLNVSPLNNMSESNRDAGVAIPVIAAAVFIVWLGVGIRQWMVLSKWSQKYRMYKELQRKLDERLDFDKNNEGSEEKQQ